MRPVLITARSIGPCWRNASAIASGVLSTFSELSLRPFSSIMQTCVHARLDVPGFQFLAEPGAVVAAISDEMRGWRQGVKDETGTLVVAHLAF
jgi:hypothetical protein